MSAPWPGFLSSSSSFIVQVRRVIWTLMPVQRNQLTSWYILFSFVTRGGNLFLCFQGASPSEEAQSPSDSDSLGASVKLTCTLYSEYSNYDIGWYQEQPEKAPKCLMWLRSNGNYDKGDGIPDRFSGSSSGAHCYLSISNIQSEDEAIYFCGTCGSIGGQYK